MWEILLQGHILSMGKAALSYEPQLEIEAIYLWSQVVLFCFVMLNLSDHDASCHAPGIFGKLLKTRGALTWFDSVWSYGVEAIDYWTIFSMKIK
jgi:hypothetical protein